MFIGNNWDGTATVVDVRTRKAIKRINIIPDRREELLEIYAAPDRLAFYLAIQQVVGEGHDQYVDDMFTTPRRQPGRGVPAELLRRGVDRPRDREGRVPSSR